MPIVFHSQSGMSVKIELYTVPGQVVHDSTRKLVLQAPTAWSSSLTRKSKRRARQRELQRSTNNLKQNSMDPSKFPMVIRFNKHDLPKVRSDAECARIAQRGREPVFAGDGVTGAGRRRDVFGLMNITWDDLEGQLQLTERSQLSRTELFGSLLRQLRAGNPSGEIRGAGDGRAISRRRSSCGSARLAVAPHVTTSARELGLGVHGST